jgi:hypothetical protein
MLDPHWVRTWAADLQTLLSALDPGYPFPPAENEVTLAGATREHPGIPPDLATFYEVVQEVTMADVGNGFFLHAHGDGPVLLGTGGTVFASNGGGILYAIDHGNTVHRSHAASTDSGFEPVAPDLRSFLAQVLNGVAHFAATSNPPDL